MATTEKRLERIKRLTKAPSEPITDAFKYKLSLMEYMSYHNTNTSDKDRRKWAEEYLQEKGIKFRMSGIHDREFRVLGSLVRLIALDAYIAPEEEDRIKSEISRLKEFKQEKEVEAKDAPVKKESNKGADKASEFLGEFEGLIDEYFETRKIPNIQALLTSMSVTGASSSIISAYAERRVAELRVILEDNELRGCYSLSKPEFKRLIGIYESLKEKGGQVKRVVNRAPRAKKEKPAGVLVQNLKFKQSDEELGLKSVSVTGIIGANEVYIFRCDGRKLQYFKAVDGMTLTVKGTTILNFDTEKSHQKTIRKPEILKDFHTKGKRDAIKVIKEIRSVEGRVNGRTSEHAIILSTFK